MLEDSGFDDLAKRRLFDHLTEGAPELATSFDGLLSDIDKEAIERGRVAEDMYPNASAYRMPEALRRKEDLDSLLDFCLKYEVNDIKFGDSEPITVRIHGKIYRLTHRSLSKDEVNEIICHLYESTTAIGKVLSGDRLDFAYSCRKDGRVHSRWRICVTLRGLADGIGFRVVCRQISVNPPTVEQVYMPQDITAAVMKLDRGIMLVTGPTGSGKSTTLAALLRERCASREHSDHLITIESPIEYLHTGYPHPFTEVTQWEVPRMLSSFALAVETSLRSDPDLVLIGEMRDRQTMKAGLEVSLTGHGCFSTMHTNSCVQTVTRFLQAFDKEEVAAVQYDLVDNLHMIVSQLLRPGPDGRRVALRERLEFDGQIKDRLRSSANLSGELRKVMESYGRLMVEEARDRFKEGRLTEDELKRIEWMDSKERAMQ